jgi:NADH-quinone oxidoreductase subunit G
MVIVGAGAFKGALRAAGAFAAAAGVVKDGWNGWNVLHTGASHVGALDLGFAPKPGGLDAGGMAKAANDGKLDTLFLLGADDDPLPERGKATVVYLGTHGDAGAHLADIILPGAAYAEKNATWVNTEGRVQYGRRAAWPKGEAREDWSILRALSAVLGKTLPYDSLAALRAKMIADHPTFGHVDYAPGASDLAGFDPGALGAASGAGTATFSSPVRDFYLTNVVARASRTMAECSKAAGASAATRVAAE